MFNVSSDWVRTHKFYVYELIGDDGNPFYVGRTSDPQRRLAQHLDPRASNTPAHRMLIQQKSPSMRLVAGFNTLDEAVHGERMHIERTPGLVNRPAGRRKGGQALKIKLDARAIIFMDEVRLNYRPPIERGSYLSALLSLVREKYPELAKEAAMEALRIRGDAFVVAIDSLPPITGCTSTPGATLVAP